MAPQLHFPRWPCRDKFKKTKQRSMRARTLKYTQGGDKLLLILSDFACWLMAISKCPLPRHQRANISIVLIMLYLAGAPMLCTYMAKNKEAMSLYTTQQHTDVYGSVLRLQLRGLHSIRTGWMLLLLVLFHSVDRVIRKKMLPFPRGTCSSSVTASARRRVIRGKEGCIACQAPP